MENQEKGYILDIPVHCEHGHLLETISMQKENLGKNQREKTKTFRFIIIASCEKCEKLMSFNVAVAITKNVREEQILPRIKGLPAISMARFLTNI